MIDLWAAPGQERVPGVHCLVAYGAPRTKKTHNQMVLAGNRRIVLPSKAWKNWVASARLVEILPGGQPHLWPLAGRVLPERPYNCAATFYRDAAWGDACGFYQGLGDFLQNRGVLRNDKWIVSWDGSRLMKDKANPRVEITLIPVP